MARRMEYRARIARSLWRALAILVPTTALTAFSAGTAAADPLPGEALFVKNCGTCHVISQMPSQRQGPNLFGVIGRQAGKLPGFTYSKALARAKFTWTEDKIDAWLSRPGEAGPRQRHDLSPGRPGGPRQHHRLSGGRQRGSKMT